MALKDQLHKEVPFALWFPLLLAVAAAAIFSVWFFMNQALARVTTSKPAGLEPVKVVDESPTIPSVMSMLDGMPLETGMEYARPIGVVIENYGPIRAQQQGLAQAALVYESLAEGGITRFLAVYSGNTADQIGPVRSAREYFIDWAHEVGAAFAHVGGSPEALNTLSTTDAVFNIDEVSGHEVIWRSDKFSPPHNAFTSVANIVEAMETAGYSNELKTPRFTFKNPDDVSGDTRVITIDFSTESYIVKYAYDPVTHHYKRFNGGKSHHDLSPANVIVQVTQQNVIDEEGRLNIQTAGTGKALVFRDGQAIEGTWKKEEDGFTRFLDTQGNDIPLNRGQTWIEVVPANTTVNYF